MSLTIRICICTLLPQLTLSVLRIGHLQSTPDEDKVLRICTANTSITLITLPACSKFNGLENVARLHHDHAVHVIMGASCDIESETVSRLAELWDSLYMSPSLYSALERGNSTFSLRPFSPVSLASALIALCHGAGWERVGLVHADGFSEFAESIGWQFAAKSRVNVSITVEVGEYHWRERIQEKARVLLVLGSMNTFETILLFLLKDTSRPTEFVLIYIDSVRQTVEDFFEQVHRIVDKYDLNNSKKNHKLAQNVFYVQSMHPDWNIIQKWAIQNNMPLTPNLESQLLLCDALAMLSSIENISTTTAGMKEQLIGRPYHGFSGHVFFAPNGLRLPFFHVFCLVDGSGTVVASIEPERKQCNYTTCVWHSLTATSHTKVSLLGSPRSIPECGFDGQLCSHLHTFLLAAVVALILIVPLVIAFYFQRKEKELQRMPWRVAYEQLSFAHEADNPGYRRISTASSGRESHAEDPSDAERKHGYVGGCKVSIRSYAQKRSITFTRKEMERLNQLKHLSHANVNSFHGLSCNQNAQLVVLWSFCVRGSLDDVLFANAQQLGRNFQATFVKHILNGLQYIHQSPIRVHGRLFLSNCLIDSYWVVKLTDFGLSAIIDDRIEHKEIAEFSPLQLDKLPRRALQLPPESLHQLLSGKRTFEFSVPGDIYQLGMVVYQILFYRRPFRENNKETNEIAQSICDESKSTPLRPKVPTEEHGFTMRMLSVMQQCWLYRPDARPALFKIIDAVAREFGHDAKGTLIDQMVQMLNEYSSHLEQIVARRTEQLEAVHARTEALLYQIMPRSVADALRDGIPVRPQLHASASVLVSDVCQFNSLCESCIPEHIIEILQQLYSSFDHIVSNYDAFKVENVGDAYLLVSGIPALPDQQHIAVVCRIALELIKFVAGFVAIHRPEHKLQIKIGISCGALASGILGSSAPRFCVFGDSVNMACRLAGAGLPDKIQVSEGARIVLNEKYPEFILEERGMVNLKGKGTRTTFWLNGVSLAAPCSLPNAVP